jgi:uncharacterized protein YyaL (SSP411 family)
MIGCGYLKIKKITWLQVILKIDPIRYFLYIPLVTFLFACTNTNKKSRLATASSPYLQEHADNPVDWYEWNDEAIATAKKENKPLLISIGYAACHWCHEMEKESFMDTGVARVMNENFICIKVDREERPDIDNIYMNACQLISGNGGWPLNAFALPDGKPFFAGTYYSKSGWISLLNDISKAYKEKHDLLVKQAEGLTKGIADQELSFATTESTATTTTGNNYQNLFDSIYVKLDTVDGGIKGSPKFPMPAVTEFLLQYYYLTNNKTALDAATTSLDRMALGGIYDQLAGGFARYSIDDRWHVPHFEKMLYDNGQLISLYAHAYQLTQNEFYKKIVTETISFLENELASSNGAFYSSLNADTEDGEGEFYAWKENDFNKATNSDPLIAEYFNISSAGNWNKARNILLAKSSPQQFAKVKNLTIDQFNSQLNKAKKSLLEERNKRKKPSVDTKILTSWNAMMLKGYLDAYAGTGNEKYLVKAVAIAKFIEKNMLSGDGRLMRNFKDGKTSINGFLDDHAWTAHAFIKLYSTNFDIHWLELAKKITDHTIENFYNKPRELFYYSSASNEELVVRKTETDDDVIPSSNAIMANVLYSLGVIYENNKYSEMSRNMLTTVAGKLNTFPVYHAQWGNLAGIISTGTYEVVLIGKDAIEKNKELQKKYLPDCIVMGATDKENLPLLESKLQMNKTLIYVCTNKLCKRPVEEVDSALTQIKKKV